MNRRFPSSSDWTLIHRNGSSSNSGSFLFYSIVGLPCLKPALQGKEDESSSELFSLRTTVG